MDIKRTIRSVALIAALALFLSVAGATGASADSGAATLQYLIATDFLCGLPPDARGPDCPVVSMAANGDTVEMSGSGTLSLHPKSVTGGGIFTEKDPAGNVLATGAWTATELLSFHSYGSGSAQGTPPAWEGGQALILVQLSVGGTPVADAVLRVTCTLGDKIPASTEDGVRLAIQGGPNFDQEVSGFTLFIRQ